MMRTFPFIFLISFFTAGLAQVYEPPTIHFKQRVLRPNPRADDVSDVDSFHFLHLMIGGNVYQTEKHINYCYNEETHKYNFRDELKYIQPILSLGDITIANLKTAFANDSKNMFCSPDEFALAVKYSGINAVMHANLHTANIDKGTMQRTRDMLLNFGLYHTGAFADNVQRTGNYPLIIHKKGFTIAILDYTTAVKRPAISRDFIINEIDKSAIERDMRLARASKPDFTIVYFDWGAQKQDLPSYYQMDIAQYCFQLGADLVTGTFPNTPMRIDFIHHMKNGNPREGIVAYSLGNLIASNDDVSNRTGFLLDIELKKNSFTRETNVSDWGVIPVYTYYDTTSVKGKMRVMSVPSSNVENGDILPNIPYTEKRRVVNSAYQIRQLLAATADEIQYNETELVANNVQETIDLTNAPINNKFQQTRKETIKPSDAPVLPLATLGSNNPPSLAMIYETDKNVPAKNGTQKKTEEKKKTEGQNITIDNTPVVSIPANDSIAKVLAGIDKKDTTAAVANQNSKNAETKNPVQEKKQESNKETAENPYPTVKTEKKNEVSTEQENKKPSKAIAINEEEEAEEKNKNKSANTNYHTTGNDYELKEKEIVQREKKVTTTKKEDRPDDTKVETTHKTTEGITTNLKNEIETSMKPVENRNLKLVIDTFYRIQFYALKKFIPLDTNYYTHLKGYEVFEDAGLFKYLLGKYRTFEECDKYWRAQILPRYKTSFIVKYIDGKRVLD